MNSASHSHLTRVVLPEGECAACDEYHGGINCHYCGLRISYRGSRVQRFTEWGWHLRRLHFKEWGVGNG